jgi:hypothetical protein
MRLVSRYLILSALFLTPIAHPFSRSASATPDDSALAADNSLKAAITKADQAGFARLLDPEFTWTDRTGKTRSKVEILPALASLTADPDADIKVINAGQIVLIHGNHRVPAQNASVRFLRVWVKRPQAWQLLIYQETNKAEKNPEKRSGFGAPSNGQPVACENPCKTVPYKPDAAAEQEVVAMWQAVERTVLTNDVEAWTPNFTDDFIFVTPDGGSPLNKADRVAMITELRRTNTTLIPAEVSSMKVWVLGDAAVMRSEHKPLHGKVLHVTRLFEKRNGHWQIAFGQQTWIE